MRLIYTRQAKSFLVTDEGLYGRPAAPMMIEYMVKASDLILFVPEAKRKGAIRTITQIMHEAWKKVQLQLDRCPAAGDSVDMGSREGLPLPDLSARPEIHTSMHFCFDVLEDLDRLTAYIQSDPYAEHLSNLVFNCWMAVYRAADRFELIDKRIRSGGSHTGQHD